ncbi:MAG TPA: SDR family NAD(P)-dependent oxidoreductase, partial [Terrimicrobiaceae bacterium]|nr:SDR family NAD(P)-dependent oxidoreductase [Terrimicrobiaceae bacterium]
MNLHLDNKLALVTASSGGIGLEIAAALAAEGARVIVNGRTEDSVREGMARIRAHNPEAKLEPLASDHATPEGCARTIQAFPDVDILVNNLGIYEAV